MTTGWIEQVAERANVSVIEVDEAIKRLGISTQQASHSASRLTVTSIAFQGEKRGNASGRIYFEWRDLTPGIWSLASYGETEGGNLVGKSSVLEIILGSLRGKLSGIQPDVLSWLEKVTLEFKLNEQSFVVEFSLEEGIPSGSISKGDSQHPKPIDTFTSLEGFTAVMGDFMLDQLGLSQIPTIRKDDDGGKRVLHGWPALASALHFGGDHKHLLGNKTIQGLPGRMFHMYIGLPWALPLMQARTIKTEFDQKQSSENKKITELATRFKKKLEEANTRLKSAEDQLAALAANKISTAQLDSISQEVISLTQKLSSEDLSIANATKEARELRLVSDEDERHLRNLKEDFVAHSFFNGLNPSFCPRCETSISRAKQQLESEQMVCSVCSESIPRDQSEEIAEAIILAEQRRDASRTASEQAEHQLSVLATRRNMTSQELRQVSSELAAARDNVSYQRTRNLEIEIAKLKGFAEAHV